MSQSKSPIPLCQHYIRFSARLGVEPSTFLMNVNDIHKSSNQMRFVHFTDDTTVFASDSDINNVRVTVNMELVGVDNWLKTNRLSLNVSKTSYNIISNQKNAFDIKIREPILTKVSTVKFLGLTLDENLTFNDHVNKVISKISKSVSVIMKLHCQLEYYKLYYSLVNSHLTYALLAWGRYGRTNAVNRLSVPTGEHANYSQIIWILTFHPIYDYFALLTDFNTNTLDLHQYFKDKLSCHQPSHMHTRHRTNSIILILHF